MVVAGVLGRQLVGVIGRIGDLMNVWPEEETYKLLVPDALMVKPLVRKAIREKLREENKDIKNGKRYLKYWGQAKVTEFIFDVVGAAEAERLVKNGIKWEGKTRRVSVLKKGEEGWQRATTIKKILVQTKRKQEEKKEVQQLRKAPFSFVICYNCGGKEHTMKSCTLASRAVSKKIERKMVWVDKGKNRMNIINDDGFTKVVNMQRTPSPTPGPALKTPTPELRIVELVSDWDKIETAKTKVLVEKVERDGWKVQEPLTGPFQW